MSSKKYYKSWNIKGIAESVIEEIKEDGEDLDNVWIIICKAPIGAFTAENLKMP